MFEIIAMYYALTTPVPLEYTHDDMVMHYYQSPIETLTEPINPKHYINKNILSQAHRMHLVDKWCINGYKDYSTSYLIDMLAGRYKQNLPVIDKYDFKLIPNLESIECMVNFVSAHIKTLKKYQRMFPHEYNDYQEYINYESKVLDTWRFLAILNGCIIEMEKGNYEHVYSYRCALNQYIELVGENNYKEAIWPMLDPTIFNRID